MFFIHISIKTSKFVIRGNPFNTRYGFSHFTADTVGCTSFIRRHNTLPHLPERRESRPMAALKFYMIICIYPRSP